MDASTAARESEPPGASPVLQLVNVAVATVLLVLVAPALALIALAIRADSRGRVLERARRNDAQGRPFELLTFRTTVEGARTDTHERLRAVIDDAETAALTPVGSVLSATRLHRLPRLLNAVQGHVRLF